MAAKGPLVSPFGYHSTLLIGFITVAHYAQKTIGPPIPQSALYVTWVLPLLGSYRSSPTYYRKGKEETVIDYYRSIIVIIENSPVSQLDKAETKHRTTVFNPLNISYEKHGC